MSVVAGWYLWREARNLWWQVSKKPWDKSHSVCVALPSTSRPAPSLNRSYPEAGFESFLRLQISTKLSRLAMCYLGSLELSSSLGSLLDTCSLAPLLIHLPPPLLFIAPAPPPPPPLLGVAWLPLRPFHMLRAVFSFISTIKSSP